MFRSFYLQGLALIIAGLLVCPTEAGAQAQPYSSVWDITDGFGPAEVKALQDLLNTPEFQAPLAKYSCGDPVPKLTFSVSLRTKSRFATRAVEVSYTPGFSPSDNSKRCLMFAVSYLVDKAVAGLDPDPKMETTREPRCDCSKRNGKEEWVDFPGPDEVLNARKVAAENAAIKADEDQQVKEENLQTIHFDATGVQVTPSAGEILTNRETSLGKLPPNAELLVANRDFTHWACAVKQNGKESVLLDGVAGKAYDAIPYHQELEFSPDGKHLAYVAQLKDKFVVVMDGKEGKPYEVIEDLYHPRFSPDSRHLAYIATKPALVLRFPPAQDFMVLDGTEQKGYDLVEGILFSSDSKHLAYNADVKWNQGTSVVLDGKEGPAFDQIFGARFSPDGKRLAYVAFNRTNRSRGSMGMDFVVVDGKQGKRYKSVSGLQFSPDSRHLDYVAGVDTSSMKILVRDGVETNYADVDAGTFSPDSQHLAYTARFGTNWLLLVDGKKLDPQPQFGDADPMRSPIRDCSFSPDSRHISYVRFAETNFVVVLDGLVIATNSSVPIGPVFTPDNRRLAYVAGYGARSDAPGQYNKVRPVLGGLTGHEYDQMLTWRAELHEGGQTFGFTLDEKGVLHGIGVRDGEVWRIELEIMKK